MEFLAIVAAIILIVMFWPVFVALGVMALIVGAVLICAVLLLA